MAEKVTQATFEQEIAFEFIRRYHPETWCKVEEKDLSKVIELCHALFRTRPDLLEATTNTRLQPTQ